ncbi:MAG: hypothetical protein HKN68_00215 [Saprospiraceae bacterium]|nr:hypothetical protein [Saprospiraceae bacterium]
MFNLGYYSFLKRNNSMNYIGFLLLTLITITGYSLNESAESENLNSVIETGAHNQVTICHLLGNGDYKAIDVNEKAVDAHLDHGDQFPGYSGPFCVLTENCEKICF